MKRTYFSVNSLEIGVASKSSLVPKSIPKNLKI